jgi:hypothetical protein
MFRTSVIGVVLLSAALAASDAAAQPAGATSYTFVAQWQVPRGQWETFVADFEKNTRPVLEKLAANGTLVGWGAFESIVHTHEGYTHGTWWSSTSAAGIEQARLELRKAAAASTSLTAATAHRDYYLRSLLGNGKAASGTDAYLQVSSFMVKPGQGTEWRQGWEKYFKPLYDDLVSKGLLVGYSVDVEDVHTESPLWRHVVTLSPNIGTQDKITAAFDAAAAKRSPEEQKALTAGGQATLEPGAHRDMYARVIRHWSK